MRILKRIRKKAGRLEDLVGTMITGLLGTVITLGTEYLFMRLGNTSLGLYLGNLMSSVCGIIVLERYYEKKIGIKRKIAYILSSMISVVIINLIRKQICYDITSLELIFTQACIGLLQFLIGYVINVVVFKERGKTNE